MQISLTAQESIPQLDVPYVTTPIEVVNAMLQIANVSAEDTLYDLGCGDGRIVIKAAQKFGAFGIGVDLDPVRIDESRENAAQAGVADRTKFFVEDFFKADFGNATVITLYVKEEMNLKLRPMLLQQLKPGARIVSHNYGMGEWEPDELTKIKSSFDTHKIYLWIVPANVSGLWEWTFPIENGNVNYKITLSQKFQKVEGTISFDNIKEVLRNLKLRGNYLSFEFDYKINGENTPGHFEGFIDGDIIEGSVIFQKESGQVKNSWKAKRDAHVIIPIDRTK
ncbi:SAM-dependent methyltransferase [Bacteroidota bacterium]